MSSTETSGQFEKAPGPNSSTRNRLIIEDRRDEIISLYTQGMSQRKIAEKVGISVGLVNRDIKKRLEGAAKDHPETAQLRQKLAWKYEDAERRLRAYIAQGKDQEEQAVRHLKVFPKLRQIWEDYRKMFGVDSPQQVDLGLPAGTNININLVPAAGTNGSSSVVAVPAELPPIEGETVEETPMLEQSAQ